jgi:arginase
MARFVVIEVPYHMGLENAGVGRGPARFLSAGADRALAEASAGQEGCTTVLHVRKRDLSATGTDAIVDLNRQLRTAVRDAIGEGECPVVLAGNCNSCMGTLGGIESGRAGIVWLDAHGDFNTPETSLSGALDGMALAAAVGHCHEELRERSGMSRPVAPENVLLLGCRDLDPAEPQRLAAAGVIHRDAGDLSDAAPLIADLRARVDAVYVHIDMDFLDPAESPGVNFRGPGGVPLNRAEMLLALIALELPVAAVAVTNHNPEYDPEGLTPAAGLRLLRAMASAVPSHAPR